MRRSPLAATPAALSIAVSAPAHATPDAVAVLLDADLTAQSQALAAGQIGSQGLTQALLERIAQRQPELNAYLHIDAIGALQSAAASDQRRAAGRTLSALDGLSVAVKDNIDVAGMPTTAGMATRRGRLASTDAFVVQQLRAAGMVVLGKLNMHEAALGATNDNPHYGRCEHPLRRGFTPGGSSGGSACAVAAGLCALALGTDTMGSVRLPAAYCGVVGFKGSSGVVSTTGSVACGRLLDHIGPLTRSQRDLAMVWPLMAVYDAACAEARLAPTLAPGPTLAQGRSLRFVAAADIHSLGATPEVSQAYQRAMAALRALGHTVNEIALAGWDFGRARRAGLLVVEADLLVEHAEDWRSQPHNFSPALTKGLQWAERQSAAAYAAALRSCGEAHAEVARWWMHGEVMLLPTTPQTAFEFGAPVPANQADLTSIANLAGVPAMTVPLPVAAGQLPIGLQAIAPAGAEALLIGLDLAAACAPELAQITLSRP